MSVPPLPMVVTGDPLLLDDLLRLAAAAGTELDVAPDPAAARPHYLTAPRVFVGADQAQPCLRAGLPRRDRVVLIGQGEIPNADLSVVDPFGIEHIVTLPEGGDWVIQRLREPSVAPAIGRLVAVLGGRGGAGASTLAGGLAVTAAAAGRRTLLVDADPLGGGLDLLLGWEQVDGLRWGALAGAAGRVDPPALLDTLPQRGDLVLLSFDRDELPAVPGEAMAAALDAARRGRDVIVADLPRQLDDAAVLALQSADRAVLVVPAELRAAAAASRVAQTARLHCPELSVVVRGPAPGKLRPREVAAALSLPLAGSLRPEPALCRAIERGEAPAADGKGPLADLCRKLIGELVPA